ncbi:hypothetical protein DL762_009039 [Monosporascus cannonballus]|uniref:cytidine deaminase n=1 Tax=Monosporascus cannonballus TaxID=155416 RepID=A0ABY0GUH6_9PEZI|nr:hypothetical protein DL762_009039 [Monosporascus cannonballus]
MSPYNSDTYKTLVEQVSEESPNSKIIPYPFNVAKEHETLVLIAYSVVQDEVLNAFGRLDVWVCSSGLLGPPSIEATTPDDLQKCFEAHSLAPFFALKYVPAAMAKLTQKGTYLNAAPKTQKYGSIIVISSVASVHGGCWGPCYTMTSHAALGVVKAGVATLKGTGVRINCISPGQIDVGVDLQGFPPASLQKPEVQRTTIGLERAGKTQEVARVAGFLASGFSSYVTGANLIVDGGASLGYLLAIIGSADDEMFVRPSMSSSSLAQFGVIASNDPSAIESTCRDYGLSGAEFKELHERCVAAKSSAYCPYSKFRVGASVISVDGSYFDGGNIENASYPVGTCAERVALGKAVSEGHLKIKAVAVATDISPPASPCGMCRQFIREFCDLKSPIIMFDKNDNYVVLRLEEILPMSFGPEALPPPGSLKS